jgi:hypothetical protein
MVPVEPTPANLLANHLDDRPDNWENGGNEPLGMVPVEPTPANLLANHLDDRPDNWENGGKQAARPPRGLR